MEPRVVVCNSSSEELAYAVCRLPCLAWIGAACGGHWAIGLGRIRTVAEMLNLMGLPVSVREKGRRAGLSEVQAAQMVGIAAPRTCA